MSEIYVGSARPIGFTGRRQLCDGGEHMPWPAADAGKNLEGRNKSTTVTYLRLLFDLKS